MICHCGAVRRYSGDNMHVLLSDDGGCLCAVIDLAHPIGKFEACTEHVRFRAQDGFLHRHRAQMDFCIGAGARVFFSSGAEPIRFCVPVQCAHDRDSWCQASHGIARGAGGCNAPRHQILGGAKLAKSL